MAKPTATTRTKLVLAGGVDRFVDDLVGVGGLLGHSVNGWLKDFPQRIRSMLA
jgi:hypothetical protein